MLLWWGVAGGDFQHGNGTGGGKRRDGRERGGEAAMMMGDTTRQLRTLSARATLCHQKL